MQRNIKSAPMSHQTIPWRLAFALHIGFRYVKQYLGLITPI